MEVHLQWESLLLEVDYIFVYADGLNRFYLAREHEDLAGKFQYPPNVFDDFVSAANIEANIRASAAEAKADAAEAKAGVLANEVNDMCQSLSWRLTAPLRSVELAKKLAKKLLSSWSR